MQPSEAQSLYDDLGQMLREVGLGWVVEQVVHEVAAGKTLKKTLSLEAEELTDRGSPRRQPVQFVSTEPYTEKEWLGLLVDAMEQAVVATTEMQEATLKIIGAKARIDRVLFASQTIGIEGHAFSWSDAERHKQSGQKLRTLCEELRLELQRAD